MTAAPPGPASGSRRRLSSARLGWLAVGVLVIMRTALSLHDISRPGLQMDETLFVNAATLRIPGIFIQDSFHGIPLMVFPYIGALKAWIYDPLFAVFGTSATLIRVPVVVVVGAGLLLLFQALLDVVNRPVAVLATALLCFDNSVFWLTRDDVGPSAFEFALKCAALLCAARFARSPRPRWVVLLLVCLGLGVFNKLNFIWIVNATVVASAVIMVLHRRSLRARWRLIVIWVAGLTLIYLCWGLYYFLNHIASIDAGSGGALTQPWFEYREGTSATLSGTLFYNYALAPLASRTAVVWIVLALFAAGSIISMAVPRLRSLAIFEMALATMLIAIQTFLTPQATAGWHYIAIYPFVTIVAAYGAYALASLLLRRSTLVYAAVACVGVLGLIYTGLLMGKYFEVLSQEPQNSAWSPAIYTLSADLRHVHATIFTADWGIFDPLFALDPGRRYSELSFGLENSAPANLAQLRNSVASVPGPKLIVTHPNDRLMFPLANINLFRTLGAHLHLADTVTGAGGVPVYQVYSYR